MAPGTGNSKKIKLKNWLMRMHRNEILHNFAPNLREIYFFGFFLAKRRPI